jgi:hypothetical protein
VSGVTTSWNRSQGTIIIDISQIKHTLEVEQKVEQKRERRVSHGEI